MGTLKWVVGGDEAISDCMYFSERFCVGGDICVHILTKTYIDLTRPRWEYGEAA